MLRKKFYRYPRKKLYYVIECPVGGESYAAKEVIIYYQN